MSKIRLPDEWRLQEWNEMVRANDYERLKMQERVADWCFGFAENEISRKDLHALDFMFNQLASCARGRDDEPGWIRSVEMVLDSQLVLTVLSEFGLKDGRDFLEAVGLMKKEEGE
jgi:hypothetical protein